MRVKPVVNGDGTPYGVRFDCPGCKEPHGPQAWGFNGDHDRPTLSPSILVHPAPRMSRTTPRYHSFVRDGRIEFCGDSEHELAGTTVDLGEVE